MSEKKQVSRPAAKPATTARRVAGKATPKPRAKAKPAEGVDFLTAELRAIYQKATEEAEKRPPSGWKASDVMKHFGTISEETAAVLEETVRWLRAEDEGRAVSSPA